jgi:hypothetical protein
MESATERWYLIKVLDGKTIGNNEFLKLFFLCNSKRVGYNINIIDVSQRRFPTGRTVRLREETY